MGNTLVYACDKEQDNTIVLFIDTQVRGGIKRLMVKLTGLLHMLVNNCCTCAGQNSEHGKVQRLCCTC